MDGFDRLKQAMAVVIGGLFVAVGCVIWFGNPGNAKAAYMQTAPLYEMVRDFTEWFGKAGAGAVFVVFGLVIGILMFRAASR